MKGKNLLKGRYVYGKDTKDMDSNQITFIEGSSGKSYGESSGRELWTKLEKKLELEKLCQQYCIAYDRGNDRGNDRGIDRGIAYDRGNHHHRYKLCLVSIKLGCQTI